MGNRSMARIARVAAALCACALALAFAPAFVPGAPQPAGLPAAAPVPAAVPHPDAGQAGGSGNAAPGSGDAMPGSGDAAPGSGNAAPGSGDAVPDSPDSPARAIDRAAGVDPGVVLVDLAPGATADDALADLAERTGLRGFGLLGLDGTAASIALPPQMSVAEAAEVLATLPSVDDAQANFTYEPQDAGTEGETLAGQLFAQSTLTNDPYVVEGKLWALESIRAYEAWDSVRVNRSVTVAVLDDGFNVNHEDLKDNMLTDWAFNADAAVSRGKTIADAASLRTVAGGRGHGTHVAGIVAGTANNSKGVAGISYNARVLPVKVFSDATNLTSTEKLVMAYDYVLAHADELNIRVVNMSLGGGRDTLDWSAVDKRLINKIDAAYQAGIVTVVSACNEGSTGTKPYTPPFYCFPGDVGNVVTVVSLKRDGNLNPVREEKSNYNKLDQHNKNIAAPGNLIWSTTTSPDDAYVRQSGTSMAAPYVSGTLALMFAADDELHDMRSAEVSQLAISRLESTAHDLQYSNRLETAAAGWDSYTGWGEVDAAAAVASNAVAMAGPESVMAGKGAQMSLQPAQSGWTWSSDNPAVASVSATGLVTGHRMGTANITAQNPGGVRFAVKTISVFDPSISGPTSMQAFSTAAFSVPATPIGTYTWTTSDSSVATVNAAGVVTARKAGTFTLSVRLGSNAAVASSKTVTVTMRPASSLAVTVPAQAYTGKALKPVPTVKVGTVALVPGTDYAVSYANNTKVGTAKLTVSGKGSVTGSKTVTFAIGKGANPIEVKVSAKTAKASAVAKKAQTLAPLSVKKAQGAVSYKKKSGNAKIAVNAKTGKFTVKKGLKKGAYKVKVSVTAKGNANYNAATKTVTATVKVK